MKKLLFWLGFMLVVSVSISCKQMSDLNYTCIYVDCLTSFQTEGNLNEWKTAERIWCEGHIKFTADSLVFPFMKEIIVNVCTKYGFTFDDFKRKAHSYNTVVDKNFAAFLKQL